MMSNDNSSNDAGLERMKRNLDEIHEDEVLCRLYYRLLYWHQVLCMIPLGVAFLSLLILPNENIMRLEQVFFLQIPIFACFWLGEAVMLRYFMTLPDLNLTWEDAFKPSFDKKKDVRCVYFGRVSFAEIVTSPYLYTNYGGWIAMFAALGAVLTFAG